MHNGWLVLGVPLCAEGLCRQPRQCAHHCFTAAATQSRAAAGLDAQGDPAAAGGGTSSITGAFPVPPVQKQGFGCRHRTPDP